MTSKARTSRRTLWRPIDRAAAGSRSDNAAYVAAVPRSSASASSRARTSGSVQGIGFLIVLPLSFGSNTYVDPATMPGWLRAFVEVNPISHLVTGVRSMMAGSCDMAEIMWTLIASAAFVLIFGTLTMRLYNRK